MYLSDGYILLICEHNYFVVIDYLIDWNEPIKIESFYESY